MKKNTVLPAIILNHISYSIPTADGSKTLLRDVDLTVERGEWLAIVGTNGSGKSTLAKVIARLHPVSSGEVLHNRSGGSEHEAGTTLEDASQMPRPFIQMVFQNPDTQLIGETVYDDVCFGLDNYGFDPMERERLAKHALATTGLLHLADTPARSLSGGQKQLLHAAGCLAVQPEMIIFDEATAMLDPMSRQQLLHTVQKLHNEGTTILWITQLLDELSGCDRIVAVESGQIAFDGSKEAFFYGGGEAKHKEVDAAVVLDELMEQAESGQRTRSACERLGFIPPYTVQVAQELIRQGIPVDPLPFTIEQLGRAVSL